MSATRDSHGPGYRLDNEQRSRVRDCLGKERISLPQQRFEQFISDIEASINRFRIDVTIKGTFPWSA
jgi:hypothetical protein